MEPRLFSTSTLLLVAVISSTGATLGQSAAPDLSTEAGSGDVASIGYVSGPQPADGASHWAESQATFGPVLPEAIRLTGSLVPPNAVTDWGAAHRLRFFGWANGGYTGSSTGYGLLAVEPRANRFGDTWLLNQTAFVLERTFNSEAWSWGFRAEYYMGADAALLRPLDSFGPQSQHFGIRLPPSVFFVPCPDPDERGR